MLYGVSKQNSGRDRQTAREAASESVSQTDRKTGSQPANNRSSYIAQHE